MMGNLSFIACLQLHRIIIDGFILTQIRGHFFFKYWTLIKYQSYKFFNGSRSAKFKFNPRGFILIFIG